MKKILSILLGVGFMGALFCGGGLYMMYDTHLAAPEIERVKLPPLEVPDERPMVGKEGVDAYGYPFKTADRLGLLALLRAERFDDLTAHIESFQDDFEADFRKEYWPKDALNAFSTADPEIGPLIEAWIKHSPNSFAPWAARARHQHATGWHYRGGGYANETKTKSMMLFTSHLNDARQDAKKALALRPKAVSVHRTLLQISMAIGPKGDDKKTFDAALEACPNCYHIWFTRFMSLTPIWGGSMGALEALVEASSAKVDDNPRLAVLPGLLPWHVCDRLLVAGKNKEALAACNDAVDITPYPLFLHERANALFRLNRFEEALEDQDAVMAYWPQDETTAKKRYNTHVELWNSEAAGDDLMLSSQLDPAWKEASARFEHQARRLSATAFVAAQDGKQDEAERLCKRMEDFRPHALSIGICEVVRGETPSQDPTQTMVYWQTALKYPKFFKKQRDLDYAVVRYRFFSEIIILWNGYIERVPNDANAYLERSGTFHHYGRPLRSKADLKRACELRSSEACNRAGMSMPKKKKKQEAEAPKE